MAHATTVALLLVCGSPSAADERRLAEFETAAADAGHIYFNPSTGERIMTRGPLTGVRGSSNEVWIADNRTPCAPVGIDQSYYTTINDPEHPDYVDRIMIRDWGLVPSDLLVDAVGLNYVTRHTDSDADGDGFADGVEGLAGEWIWTEASPLAAGWGDCCTDCHPLISFRLHDLPGDLDPHDGRAAIYFLTVELSPSDPNFPSFEVADSDGMSDAAVFNPFSFQYYDRDGDGLIELAYDFRVFQPGWADHDGDGVPDGDPADASQIGWSLVAPSAPILPDGSLGPTDPLPAAQGLEDAFAIYRGLNDNSIPAWNGVFWFGGFTCDADGSGTPGDSPDDYQPHGSFYHVLYGPAGSEPCPPDVFPDGGDGTVDFFDLAWFITLYNNGDPDADTFPPGGDGRHNFFDVVAYMDAFNAGCP